MYEYQILVRLKKTCIKNKGHIQYGNCQVCSEKYSQRCIEGSQNIKGKKNTVFMGMRVGVSGSSGGSNSNNALVSSSHSKILANLSRNF